MLVCINKRDSEDELSQKREKAKKSRKEKKEFAKRAENKSDTEDDDTGFGSRACIDCNDMSKTAYIFQLTQVDR